MAGDRIIPTCKRLRLTIGLLAIGLPGVARADASAYVRARAAAATGAVDAAAAGYGLVLATAPEDAVVAIRAYRNAMSAGDLALARRAALVLKRADVAPLDVAILDLADALRSGDRAATDDALGRLGAGPLDFISPIVRAWIAQSRGGAPFELLDSVAKDGLGQRYITEHRALLLIADGQTEAGIAAIRVQIGIGSATRDVRITAANVLAAKGKRQAARALLGDDGPAIRRIKPNAAFGAGQLFTRLADDLSGQNAEALTIVLARSALLLDPGNDDARLLLAEALKADGAYASAIEALRVIRPASDRFDAAQAERIKLIQARGDSVSALDVAATLARRPQATQADRQLYADLLVEVGREADAARVYADIVARAGEDAGWSNYLQLGGALERAGQWDAALPHLRRAVALGPDQAVALNYLGYALVDRGEALSEGQRLLERASQLRPDDPSITDSLGWAYFRAGDFARAVPLLERAAQGNAASATINEHLGDAYWAVGRRYEARYAWRAATINATAAQQMRLAEKLADGLPLQRVVAG